MALIPTDVGLRIRLDNELQPQQVTPTKEIPSDLPRLQAGQVFTAQIRDVLPQNTYVALVAGKTVTLSLPESAKSGDILELVVVDQTAKTIIAERAPPSGTAPGGEATYPFTKLSSTAQMLGNLLLDEGETPAAAALNRGQPLLAQPPRSGADLAPVLSKAVTESGLFYESHQAQWVEGKLPLARLLQEPQGQHAMPALPQPATMLAVPGEALPITQPVLLAAEGAAATMHTPTPGQMPGSQPAGETATALPSQLAAETNAAATNPPLPLSSKAMQGILLYQANQAQEIAPATTHGSTPAHAAGETATAPQPKEAGLPSPAVASNLPTIGRGEAGDATAAQAVSPNPPGSQAQAAPTMPDDLRAIVQQQLDSVGTQRLLWHGEVWPGQTMEWQLEWQEQGGGKGEESEEPWSTKLRLTMPRMGEVEASLQLGVTGVRIALTAANAEIATDMREGSVVLENALAAAGVPLLGFSVKQVEPQITEETGLDTAPPANPDTGV